MKVFDKGLVLGMLLQDEELIKNKSKIVEAIKRIEGADVQVDINDSWDLLAELIMSVYATGRIGRAKENINFKDLMEFLGEIEKRVQIQTLAETQQPVFTAPQSNVTYRDIKNEGGILDSAEPILYSVADGDYFDYDKGYIKDRFIKISDGTMHFLKENYNEKFREEEYFDEGTLFVLDIDRTNIKNFEYAMIEETQEKLKMNLLPMEQDNAENFEYNNKFVSIEDGINILYPDSDLDSIVEILGDHKIYISEVDIHAYKGLGISDIVDTHEEIIEIPLDFSKKTDYKHNTTYISVNSSVDLVYANKKVSGIPQILDNSKIFISEIDLKEYKGFEVVDIISTNEEIQLTKLDLSQTEFFGYSITYKEAIEKLGQGEIKAINHSLLDRFREYSIGQVEEYTLDTVVSDLSKYNCKGNSFVDYEDGILVSYSYIVDGAREALGEGEITIVNCKNIVKDNFDIENVGMEG